MSETELKPVTADEMKSAKIEQTFEAVEDGTSLRVLTPATHTATYTRKQLEELREQRQTELVQIIALLKKMDELGIS